MFLDIGICFLASFMISYSAASLELGSVREHMFLGLFFGFLAALGGALEDVFVAIARQWLILKLVSLFGNIPQVWLI